MSLLSAAREAAGTRAKDYSHTNKRPVSELVVVRVAWNLRVAMWFGDC